MVNSPNAQNNVDVPVSDIDRNAYEKTLNEMDKLAENLEEKGIDTLSIPSGSIGCETKNMGDSDRFGFIHVIPGNFAESFQEFFEYDEYDKYDVYRNELQNNVYLLLSLYSNDNAKAVLLAGAYKIPEAKALYNDSREEECTFTHVQKLDRTHLGSFKHFNFEKFFPKSV
ncbi:MAG: hypothetical protein ABEI06_02705 [Halobacteriaceae archaeon]